MTNIIAALLGIHLVGIVKMIMVGETQYLFIACLTSLFLGAMLWSLNKSNKKNI